MAHLHLVETDGTLGMTGTTAAIVAAGVAGAEDEGVVEVRVNGCAISGRRDCEYNLLNVTHVGGQTDDVVGSVLAVALARHAISGMIPL